MTVVISKTKASTEEHLLELLDNEIAASSYNERVLVTFTHLLAGEGPLPDHDSDLWWSNTVLRDLIAFVECFHGVELLF